MLIPFRQICNLDKTTDCLTAELGDDWSRVPATYTYKHRGILPHTWYHIVSKHKFIDERILSNEGKRGLRFHRKIAALDPCFPDGGAVPARIADEADGARRSTGSVRQSSLLDRHADSPGAHD